MKSSILQKKPTFVKGKSGQWPQRLLLSIRTEVVQESKKASREMVL